MSAGRKKRITLPTKGGGSTNVYAQLSADGSIVHVWTPAHDLGGYRIERFEGGVLNAATLRAVLTPAGGAS